jgi:hypothetical protein
MPNFACLFSKRSLVIAFKSGAEEKFIMASMTFYSFWEQFLPNNTVEDNVSKLGQPSRTVRL